MRFDYLRSARPVIVQRVIEFRIPERFQTPMFALAAAVAVVGGAWGIEAYRLREALKVQSVYESHYDVAAARLKATKVYYARVQRMFDLDIRIRRIAASGDADARALAEIANQLPPHAWLTGISHDGTGLALEGKAKDLDVVSGVLRGLMHAKDLHNPELQSAELEFEPGGEGSIKYSIHIDGTAG